MSDKLGIAILLAMAVLIVLGALALGSAKCRTSWALSGLRADWGPVQGCVVQLPDGRWLPASAIRDVDRRK